MRNSVQKTFSLACFLCLILTHQVDGAPVSQIFELENGWDAILLEVDPVDPDPESIFAGISDQLVSVWMWNSNTGTVEFIQDPTELTQSNPQFLSYLPDNPGFANSLHAIQGNSAYLIQTSGTATLTVTGEPLLPQMDWKPNSFNLAGFHLKSGSETTFNSFFSPYPEFQDADGNLTEIYVLDNNTAEWQQVLATDTDLMQKGEAFWVYCRGSSQFPGTMRVQTEQSSRLDFGTVLSTQDIRITNISDAWQHFTIGQSSSNIPLYYQYYNPDTKTTDWYSFADDAYDELDLLSGESHTLRIGVKRDGLDAGTFYETNLVLYGSSDSKGTEIAIPVSVTGTDYRGLWVGQVTLNQVNEVHSLNGADTETLKNTGSEFSFRLILHYDGITTKLLNQVVQLWSATEGPVLVTEDANLASLGPLTLRDGRPVGRRISAPAFGTLYEGTSVIHAKTMGSGFGSDGIQLEVLLEKPVGAEEDRTNPFVHQYNPDHQDYYAFQISRTITLTFGPIDGTSNFIGWGSSEVGGIYLESITGLHKDTIRMKGTFKLHKVSDITTLYQPQL